MRWGAALLLLAACGSQGQVRELSNPSVNALIALPVPQYFATLRLASHLAAQCPNYSYDERAVQAITDVRTRNEAGRFTAVQNSGAIALESDITRRSFEAKHTGATPCDALDREVAEQTALSAVLTPA